jgi:hypothetical protein
MKAQCSKLPASVLRSVNPTVRHTALSRVATKGRRSKGVFDNEAHETADIAENVTVAGSPVTARSMWSTPDKTIWVESVSLKFSNRLTELP